MSSITHVNDSVMKRPPNIM
uniref:Uncharacterized protein n=1 Tax=Rhizophora mucronata TaxID=61149 RepID=A0A2P2NPA7_RHIMU